MMMHPLAVTSHYLEFIESSGRVRTAAELEQGVEFALEGGDVGVYREAVTFPASGTANNWIQVKAEGGGAILDGAETLSGNIWEPYEGKARVWSTKIGGLISYLARDDKRFYMYDSLSKLFATTGHNDVPMNEGWYLEPWTAAIGSGSKDLKCGTMVFERMDAASVRSMLHMW